MKKFLIVIATGIAFCTAAHAAEKCVIAGRICVLPINTGNTWSNRCYDGNYEKSLDIRGVAMCSSESAAAGTTSDAPALDTNDPATNNKFCWCKMTYPAESKWISEGNWRNSYGECQTECARNCTTNDLQLMPMGYFNNLIQ